MVFSSLVFLFRFLPLALLAYFVVPVRWRNGVLLFISLIFYCWGEVRYFPIMLSSILVDYTLSRVIEAHRGSRAVCRLCLAGSLVFNLGMLGFFKYTGFFLENLNALLGTSLRAPDLVLPLGISFYTFQTLSYTIDVYRGKVEAERNIVDFGAYVALFPQLIAGPIVKYTDVNRELKERRRFSAEDLGQGAKTFVFGLGYKVLIANNVGMLWDEVAATGFGGISAPLAWLGVLAFSLQIFFDFSGYSLMAIGLGRMLGFRFPENFNYPYVSRSMTEFWRRWHMTLGSWFREYVYIPLGGNRVGKARLYFNLFVVWGATGLWHGASWNFVLWGLFFWVLLSIEKAGFLGVLERHRVLSHCYALFFLLLSWAIFAVTDFGELGRLFARLFSFDAHNDFSYYLRSYGVTLLIGLVFATPVVRRLYDRAAKRFPAVEPVVMVLLFFVCTAYLVDATYNPFLYFRF